MIDAYYVPVEKIKEVEWAGDSKAYDLELYRLGKQFDEFIIVNPAFPDFKFDTTASLPITDSNRCIVWRYKDEWIAKYFKRAWIDEQRYWEADLDLLWKHNTDINPNIVFDLPAVADLYDLNYSMTWYLDSKFSDQDKIWVVKCHLQHSTPIGEKDMGDISPVLPDQLDVIFISYNEPNAEKNWLRVREKSLRAFRVNGIKGIVNAHKAAAELAGTDMFYVVDGDAYLTDEWSFEFQPSIFDRDCVHVWRSRNPVNDLEYGYGGVKLIPRNLMLAADESNADMTTSISDKFKVMNRISNTTDFNTDAYNTWRSAFRECAKLAGSIMRRQLTRESAQRLETWCTVGADRPYGEYAIAGARAGREFGELNQGDPKQLSLINNAEWLLAKFNQQ